MKNVMCYLFLMMLGPTAMALQPWVLLTATPQPIEGVSVIDALVPAGRNDDLKEALSSGYPVTSACLLPALLHADGFVKNGATPDDIEQREVLLAAWLEQQEPVKFLRPIQGRLEAKATDGHVYGIEVDPESGDLVPVQRQSERLGHAEYMVSVQSNLTARAEHRARMQAIKTDLDQVEAALDSINVTTTGTLGVAISTIDPSLLTGNARTVAAAQKDALVEVRKVLADMKTAQKNLRQATEKLRREVR